MTRVTQFQESVTKVKEARKRDESKDKIKTESGHVKTEGKEVFLIQSKPNI